ncbi:hypothetical protein [Arthrobacter sp. H5]|uniref:hypothetical protein n=1 Tax=Arthrobacter sp. H5 TaxID=1267973 RepID=UPI0012DCAB52|nr:hypothetical protein [Arthrobacter sp. H5]
MSENSSGAKPAPDGQSSTEVPRRLSSALRLLTVAAVVLSLIGLFSLAAVLLTEFLQGQVWLGFIAIAYFCLPAAFLLMVVLVIAGVRGRHRT